MALRQRLVDKSFEHLQTDYSLDLGVNGQDVELVRPEQAEQMLVVVVIRYAIPPNDLIVRGQSHGDLGLG